MTRCTLAVGAALLLAAAALPAAAKSDNNDRILSPQPTVPWGYQQECHYGGPASQDDWFCVARPIPPQELYDDNQHHGWGPRDRRRDWDGYGRDRDRRGAAPWGAPAWGWRQQVLPEELIRRQVWSSGYHSIDRIRYDPDDNVYRVRVSDRRGRDVKLVYDAVTGRLVGKQTGDD